MTKKVPILKSVELEAPAERYETIRRYITALLEEGSYTAKELSNIIRIPERDVCDHLAHLRRTFGKGGKRLEVAPAGCANCGFVFKKRDRLTKPGKCPSCRSTRIEPPFFNIKTC